MERRMWFLKLKKDGTRMHYFTATFVNRDAPQSSAAP